MDWNSKAQAIWSTLDQMAVKDPDGYKTFIQQQMEGAQGFFQDAKTSSNLLDAVKGTGMGRNELFPGKTLATDLKKTQEIHKKGKKLESTSAATTLASELKKMEIQAHVPKSSVDTENKLTDEVFTLKSSLLSTIVKTEDTCEEDDLNIVDIRLSTECEPHQTENDLPGKSISTTVPLIQEL